MRLIFKLLFKFLSRRPSVDAELVRRFVAANSPYWTNGRRASHSQGSVLIVGYHLKPTYLMQLARAAVSISEQRGFTPLVLFGLPIYDRPEYRDYYRSFGVDTVSNIFTRYFHPALLLRSLWHTLSIYRKLAYPPSLLAVTLEGARIGDLLYDSYLLETGSPTIHKRRLHFLPFLFKKITLFYYYQYLMKKKSVSHVVLGDRVYAPLGLVLRIATSRGIPVTLTSGGYARTYSNFQETLQSHMRPPEHLVERLYPNPAVMAVADRYLSTRLAGQIEHHDVRSAFRGKRVLTREELTEELDLDPRLPNVFIMAQVFNDAPHGDDALLFTDFYSWFRETLEATRGVLSCNWIIKPHPSAPLHGESDAVEHMVAQLSIPRVHLAPANMSTASLIDVADALVTARGTAAAELACFGVPSVVAGASAYTGFGFTNEPKTREEYFGLLRTAHSLPRLTDEQIARAKTVLFLTKIATQHPSPIIPAETSSPDIPMLGGLPSQPEDQEKSLLQIIESLESGHTPRDSYFERLATFLESEGSHFYNDAVLSDPEDVTAVFAG